MTETTKNNIKKSLLKNIALGYSLVRTGSFALQGTLLPLMDRLATGKSRNVPKDYSDHLKQALPKIQKLLNQDAENISQGFYPIDVLWPENPLQHSLRIPRIFNDAFSVAKRRDKKQSAEFTAEANDFKKNLPEYYTRNFHFQTSGYLSKTSAELYDHQVEILFSGAADAMRRLIIPQLKVHLNGSDGEGLKFLEIGSGTGRLTKFMSLAFPKAQITCVDLSSFYLSQAKKHLQKFKRIDFLQGQAENLPFKDKSFDVVYSCFLFHELPLNIREAVLKESKRLLKALGLFGMVDSLQNNDDADFQWALEQFPMDFHEPFYKNYTQIPMETLLEKVGFKNIQSEIGFLSKAVSGVQES